MKLSQQIWVAGGVVVVSMGVMITAASNDNDRLLISGILVLLGSALWILSLILIVLWRALNRAVFVTSDSVRAQTFRDGEISVATDSRFQNSQDLRGGGNKNLLRGASELAGATTETKLAVVDGSNVLYWESEDPKDLNSVALLVQHLKQSGNDVVAFFDANVGFRIAGRHVERSEVARQIALPESNVIIVPGGTKADKSLLEFAQRKNATVYSRDRFRDYPEYSHLRRIAGSIVMGEVILSE